MIGAVVTAALRMHRSQNLQTEIRSRLLKHRSEVRAFISSGTDFLGNAQRHERIEVQVERDAIDRDWRMLRHVVRTPEPLLLGRDCGKDQRTLWLLRRG